MAGSQETIALTITLNGQDRVITDIQELGRVIKQSQSEIAILKDRGDETWRSYQTELDKVIEKYQELKRSVGGTSFDRGINQFLKFGNIVTQSFAAATSAINLFGGDAEEAAKRQAQANEILTLSFSVAQLVKEKDTFITIANTAAKVVNTAVTQGLTAATRLLFTTISANPMGAFLTAVTALITAFVVFKDDTDDVNEEIERLNDNFDDTNAKAQLSIQLARIRGENAVKVARDEVAAAREVFRQKQFIFFNEGKTEEQRQEYEKAAQDLILAKAKLRAEERKASEKAANDELDEIEKLRKGREDAFREQQAQLLELVKLQERYLKDLNKAIETPFPEPQALKDLQAYTQEMENLSKVLNDISLEEAFGGDIDGGTAKFTDLLISTVTDYRKKLTDAARGITDDFEDVQDELLDKAGKFIQEGLITPEAFKALKDYTEAYKILGEEGLKTNSSVGQDFQERIFRFTKQLKTNTGEIALELSSTGQVTAAQVEKSYSDAAFALEGVYERLEDALTTSIKKTNANIAAIVDPKQQEEAARNIARARIDIIKTQTDEIIKQEQRLLDFILKGQQTQEKNEALSVKARLGVISQNVDQIIMKYRELYDFDTQEAEIAFDQKLRSIIDFTQLTEEELAQLTLLYQQFYRALNNERQQDANDEQRQLQEKLTRYQNNLNQLQSIFNSYAQLTSEYYQTQLQAVDAENERTLAKIQGDTDEANQKRLDAEKIYQEKRIQIEKAAAKRALQISLAQAIANAAASIVKIAEQTGVLAPIAATIVAGINAAQVVQIASQLSSIDSYQKGGFIKGMGGLVVGPSHEYGGVKYAQGGVELEGGEAVINRVSSVKYAPLLSEINQAGGGKPLVVNNFDDSRIVEAIARQRTEPLRAYVLEQDITQKQQVQARLEQLSQI